MFIVTCCACLLRGPSHRLVSSDVSTLNLPQQDALRVSAGFATAQAGVITTSTCRLIAITQNYYRYYREEFDEITLGAPAMRTRAIFSTSCKYETAGFGRAREGLKRENSNRTL